MYHEVIISLECNRLVTKLLHLTIYYVTWLCQLTQICVPGFTDFVYTGTCTLWVDVDVWLYHADLMDSNLSLQCNFQKSNQRYVCMQMKFVRTVLGRYTDENRLLWQYLNGNQPKLILNLSQKRVTHFRQLQRE